MKGTERYLQVRANEKFAGRGGVNLYVAWKVLEGEQTENSMTNKI